MMQNYKSDIVKYIFFFFLKRYFVVQNNSMEFWHWNLDAEKNNQVSELIRNFAVVRKNFNMLNWISVLSNSLIIMSSSVSEYLTS